MQLDFKLLDESSSVHEFDCGDNELNTFLKNLALLFQKRRFGVTVTFYDSNSDPKKIIGFYTLSPASIELGLLPPNFISGPKPNPIPGFRICRLGVDKNYQGFGIGKKIFINSLNKCLDQSKFLGGSIIIIDAKHEKAKRFYEQYGFKSIPSNPLTLIQTIKYVDQHFKIS